MPDVLAFPGRSDRETEILDDLCTLAQRADDEHLHDLGEVLGHVALLSAAGVLRRFAPVFRAAGEGTEQAVLVALRREPT